jgi:hypothetical protein
MVFGLQAIKFKKIDGISLSGQDNKVREVLLGSNYRERFN